MSLEIPDCADFIGEYGCESYIDENFVQYNNFYQDQQKLSLIVDHLGDITVLLYHQDNLIVELYDEKCKKIVFMKNSLEIYFENKLDIFDEKYLILNINSKFSIKAVTR